MALRSRLILLLASVATTSACAGPAIGSTIQPGGSAASAKPTVSLVASLPRSASAIVVTPDGTVYLEQEGCWTWSDDSGNGSEAPQVLKLTAGAKLVVIAGTTCGFGGDGGPATGARFSVLSGMVVDHAGNLFVVDKGNDRIREISSQGRVSTVVGSGPVNDRGAVDFFGGDTGPATRARLAQPSALAIDAHGVLYIADQWNNRIRKVTSDGRITTVAGTGVKGSAGDGGPATSAQLWYPESLAVDGAGDLFIADQGGTRLRMVDSHGTITTVAASSYAGAPAAPLHFSNIAALAVAPDQSLFIADIAVKSQVFRLAPDRSSLDGVMNGDWRCPGTCQHFGPLGLAFDPAGNLYVVNRGDKTLIKLAWKH